MQNLTSVPMEILTRMMPHTTMPSVPTVPKAQLTSIPMSSMSTTTVVKTKNSGPKDKCAKCEKDFLVSTLEKHDGYCGRCVKKDDKEPKSSKLAEKVNCPSCNVEYTQRTLDKHKGVCGKCAASSNEKEVVAAEKVSCIKCQKDTNEKTAKKYSGFCHPCVIQIVKDYMSSQ